MFAHAMTRMNPAASINASTCSRNGVGGGPSAAARRSKRAVLPDRFAGNARSCARHGSRLRRPAPRRALLQPNDRGEVGRASLTLPARLEGRVDIGIEWSRRPFGHDADDRVRLALQENSPTNDLGVSAQGALPNRVAQDSDLGTVWAVLVLREGPADNGPGARTSRYPADTRATRTYRTTEPDCMLAPEPPARTPQEAERVRRLGSQEIPLLAIDGPSPVRGVRPRGPGVQRADVLDVRRAVRSTEGRSRARRSPYSRRSRAPMSGRPSR